ncbi:hypothetical protein ACFQPA_05450 [Halomarina halobia]|uniref:Uncharacterized protein n=1 Tax=Halomarina halobia TaxID=3033386 RepID=A0ABD6A5Y8_9EURY|nr:hypothetical protein [Halomarina sp. PSR21]
MRSPRSTAGRTNVPYPPIPETPDGRTILVAFAVALVVPVVLWVVSYPALAALAAASFSAGVVAVHVAAAVDRRRTTGCTTLRVPGVGIRVEL